MDYRSRVHHVIPGGAHTYSKGDDQFPLLAPAALERGKGGRVWDIDGNEYVDCALGLGSVSLGHAYPTVLDEVRRQLERGVNFQRPAAIELEFAEEFLAAVPGAERVKFAKNGSTVTSAAVKLARAFTGRDLVAFPHHQPFFSYDDWFIGTTVCGNGVPPSVRSLSVTFDARDPHTLKSLFRKYPRRIAAVIMEPEEVQPLPIDAVREVQEICRAGGAVFILDEMVTGYRAAWPGVFAAAGLRPDLCAWGKAMGNGFSIAALTGRAEIMDLGGIRQNARPRVFLISTTHGGEAHAIAAGRAVLREYQARDVLGWHRRVVQRVFDGLSSAIGEFRLGPFVRMGNSGWRMVLVCKDSRGNVSQAFRTLLMQEMIGRGVLCQGVFLPCFAHTEEDVNRIVSAFRGACAVYRDALSVGAEKFLHGPPARPVFRRFSGCDRSCPAVPCPRESHCRAVSEGGKGVRRSRVSRAR